MPNYEEIRDLIDDNFPDNTTGDITPIKLREVADTLTDKLEEVDEGGASLPSGGSEGQVLTKQSSTDGDADWETPTGGESTPGTVITFVTALPLTRANTIMSKTLTANVTFTEDPEDQLPGAGGTIRLTQAATPFTVAFPAGWVERPGSEGISTTDGMVHEIVYYFNGTDRSYTIVQLGVIISLTLDTPTFSADAISDTEIDLTAITYDSDSTAMIIQRATNAGFTTGLTSLYSGVPKTSHSDTGLTASTHYYYRIKTTAAGFTDSDYGYDDDTTDAGGLPALNAPTSFAVGTPTTVGAPFTWTDTNTTPAEASYLIQITTAADTTYSAIVATRTPAANATSEGAGTGLSPLVNYRARIIAIGDGVTASNSPASNEVTFTTAAATLNAPTSFAVGTPTADGAPFTWTDTNATPANESSYLIQITTTADTGYAAVVATRTPAADATSAAAGTGLTASTGYRARIKAVGNGTSTLDSAYSSEVTFTTAAGGGTLTDITFVTDGLTPSGGVYTVNDGVFTVSHKADQTLTADGYIQFDVASRDCILGFKDAIAGGDFTTFDVGSWINQSAGQLNALDAGSAITSPAPLGAAPTGGSTQIRVTRTGSAFTVQAYNGATAVGSSYTFTFSSAASPMYVYAVFSNGHLDNPKIFQ